MSRLTFASYETTEAVATLETDWRRLHEKCTYRSAFNGFDFFMASITAFSDPDIALYVLAASDQDGLVAIFPFQLSLLEFGGARLRLLEYAAQWECDKPYPLIREDCEEVAWRNLSAFLAANSQRWHRFDLVEVRDGLPAVSELMRLFRLPAYWARAKDDTLSPTVALSQPWQALWKAHPKMRKKVRRMQNKFGERLRFEVYDQEDDWRTLLDLYVQLESKGWKAGRVGIGKDDYTLSFYRELFPRLAAYGGLRFGLLSLDGEPVAIDVAYIEDKTVYFSHGTYDECYAKYSPGMVSTSLLLRHFFGSGFEEADFLAGYAGYLAPWADRIVASRKVTVYRISAPVLYALTIKAIRKLRLPRRRTKTTTSLQ